MEAYDAAVAHVFAQVQAVVAASAELRAVPSNLNPPLSDQAAQLTAIAHAMRTRLLQQKSRLEQSERQLKALSPVAVLERGYALVFNAAGKLVRSTTQVQPGDEISAQLSDGRVIAKVEKSEN